MLLLTLACTKTVMLQDGTVVEDATDWETAQGRERTKLELVRGLVDADACEPALRLIEQMRAEEMLSNELEVLHGRALRKLGMFTEARIMLEGAVKEDKRSAEAHNELGLVALDGKVIDEAVTHFNEAVLLEDNNPGFHNNLGFALLMAGRAEEALVPLRRSLVLDSGAPRTRNNLGFALVATGRSEEALELFSSNLPPSDAQYNVGLGFERQGDFQEAQTAYKAALGANPDNTKAKAALERLQSKGDPE